MLLDSYSVKFSFIRTQVAREILSWWKWFLKFCGWTAEWLCVWHTAECVWWAYVLVGHTVRCHSCKMLWYCPWPPHFLCLEELGCWPWRSQKKGWICSSACLGTFYDFRTKYGAHSSCCPVSNGAQHGRQLLCLCCFLYNFTKVQAMAREEFKWFVALYLWIVVVGRGENTRWQMWDVALCFFRLHPPQRAQIQSRVKLTFILCILITSVSLMIKSQSK